MGKNYNQISSQVACIQTSDRTFAVFLNLTPVPVERFNEILEGKVKLLLKDFSSGKGDRATDVTYNLELKDVAYLYHRAVHNYMAAPFRGTKIYGNTKEEQGQYAGLSKAFHITISRNDKTPKGEPKTKPWNITIENGYARARAGANKGAYYEESGSFRATHTVYLNLTDLDFLGVMEQTYKTVEIYRQLYGYSLIPKGLKEYQTKERRNNYEDNGNGQGSQETQASDYSKQQDNPQPNQQNDSPQQPGVDIHPTDMLVYSDFTALDGGKAAAYCLIKGKQYVVIFDNVTDDIIEAKNRQVIVTGKLYADERKKLHCAGLA